MNSEPLVTCSQSWLRVPTRFLKKVGLTELEVMLMAILFDRRDPTNQRRQRDYENNSEHEHELEEFSNNHGGNQFRGEGVQSK